METTVPSENKLDSLYKKSTEFGSYARGYLTHLSDLLQRLDTVQMQKFVDHLIHAREADKRIFFIGNGGSAATASHFANDLGVGPSPYSNKTFKAIALTDNNAVITCIANDFGYEDIFTRQLINLMEDGDLLVAISASGNSPNVIKAIEYAKKRGNLVIGLSGFDGGKLAQLSDVSINVNTAKGEYGPVEDVHMILDHLISTYLIRYIRSLS